MVGKPHADMGQTVHAVVSLAPGAHPFGIEELRAALRGRLTPYKMPRSMEVVPEIERSDAGKVRRSRYVADTVVP